MSSRERWGSEPELEWRNAPEGFELERERRNALEGFELERERRRGEVRSERG